MKSGYGAQGAEIAVHTNIQERALPSRLSSEAISPVLFAFATERPDFSDVDGLLSRWNHVLSGESLAELVPALAVGDEIRTETRQAEASYPVLVLLEIFWAETAKDAGQI